MFLESRLVDSHRSLDLLHIAAVNMDVYNIIMHTCRSTGVFTVHVESCCSML